MGPPEGRLPTGIPSPSGGVSLSGPGARLGGLDLAVLGRRGGLQRLEQVPRHVRDLLDGAVERLLVGLRGLREAADLADVLERGGADLVLGRGRLEVVQRANVVAHGSERTLRRAIVDRIEGHYAL